MEYTYIGLGLIIAAIVAAVLFFMFKPEFSMISGDNIDDSRIIAIGPNGDLYLSDNTVKNMNAFIDDIKTSITTLKTDLSARIDSTRTNLINNEIKAARSGATNDAVNEAQNRINKGNFIAHGQNIRITSSKNRCLFNAGDNNREVAKFGNQQCRTNSKTKSQEGILKIEKTT